ncbi:MAG: hypothetical protein AB7T32_06405, partial [Dehalococcoidia bacterium]
MKFIRKALLPAVIAAGFLGFLGSIGPSIPVASAADGDICAIADGLDATKAPKLFIEEGEKVYYQAWVVNGFENELTIDVDLNDFDGGDSDITSLNGASIPQTDFLNDVALLNKGNVCGPTDAEILAKTIAANKTEFKAFILDGLDRGEVCSGLPPLSVVACQQPSPGESQGSENGGGPTWSFPYNDFDIDCGLVPVLNDQCSIKTSTINAAIDALAEAKAKGTTSCNTLGTIAEDAALLDGATEFVASQFEDYVQDDCEGVGDVAPTSREGVIVVDVTCDDPGVFDLSFAVNGGGAQSIEVVCGSDA